MADKTINLHPYHAEWKPDGSDFVIEFYCTTEGSKRIKVKMHFGFWWVRFLARELWKAVVHHETEAAEARKAMTQ